MSATLTVWIVTCADGKAHCTRAAYFAHRTPKDADRDVEYIDRAELSCGPHRVQEFVPVEP